MEKHYAFDTRITLLDHGYLELVDHWGSDERIIEGARMSTDKGFQGWGPYCAQCGIRVVGGRYPEGACPNGVAGDNTHVMKSGDEKLLKYLWDNKHHTPFEMAGLTMEVQAPIFVFREWHRHRVPFSYNELSARYTPLPDVNYIPSLERLMLGSDGKNKQAGTIKGADVLNPATAVEFQLELKSLYKRAQGLYEWALAAGVPKELARVHLPVGRYSRMRASANLRGWLNFLTLRMASGAQWEIRQYANALGIIIKELHPRTWALFEEGMAK